MSAQGPLSGISGNRLLAVFDPDPDRAQERYAELFRKLTRYFEWNRQSDPEDMAQETLRRGLARLQEGQTITTADPGGYFFGIARNLIRERWNAHTQEQLDDLEQPAISHPFRNLERSEQIILLRECLSSLADDEQEMLLAYLNGEGDEWSRKSGVQPGTFRMRIYRIRQRLERLVSRVKKGEKK